MNATSKFDLQKAVKLWDEKVPRREIAARLGISETWLRTLIQTRYRAEFKSRAKNQTKSSSDWTDEEDVKASAMWAEGRTAQEIAVALDRPRNSVLARAYRKRELYPARNASVGKSPKPLSTPKQRQQRVLRDAEIFRFEVVNPPPPSVYDAERLPMAKTLVDRQSDECHWPVTAEGPFLFCAAPVAFDTCYCASHFNRLRPSLAYRLPLFNHQLHDRDGKGEGK